MYQIVTEFLRPYTLLSLVAMCSALWAWRARSSRWPLRVLLTALSTLIVHSIPAVSYLCCATLEAQTATLAVMPAETETVVVLAGGLLPPTSNRPRALLDDDTLYRCLAAADLYYQKPCLVLLTGGTAKGYDDAPPLAMHMRDFLTQLGVDPHDTALESNAQTTYENAVESHRILQQLGRRRIVLVTDAVHMPRAAACFRQIGLDVTEAPCRFVTGRFEWTVGRFIPSVNGARETERAAHEWLGLLWYWVKGRI